MNKALGLLLLLYVLFPAASSQGCGTQGSPTIYDISSGQTVYIRTPNYPDDYPEMTTCYWLVRAPSGILGYSFSSDFQLETQSSCAFDYVQLYDSSTSSNNIGTFCGVFTPTSRFTTGRFLYIVFKSDGSNSYTGFKLGVAAGFIPNTPTESFFQDFAAVSIGPIIGIIIGSLGFLAFFALFVYCCCCSQKANTRGAILTTRRVVGPTVVSVTVTSQSHNQVSPYYDTPSASTSPGVYPPLNNAYPPGYYPPPPPGHQFPPPPPYSYPPPPAYK